eukprot:1176467-Prorocentrum_minimum.AAC.3
MAEQSDEGRGYIPPSSLCRGLSRSRLITHAPQAPKSTVGQPCGSLSEGNIRRLFGIIFEMPCALNGILMSVRNCSSTCARAVCRSLPESLYAPGATLTVRGLSNRAELNGTKATVVGSYNSETDRYNVRLHNNTTTNDDAGDGSEQGGETIAIKAANLVYEDPLVDPLD